MMRLETVRIFLTIVIAMGCSGCISTAQGRQLPNGKELLVIKIKPKQRLSTSLGFTNKLSFGAGDRDSTGDRLWFFATAREIEDKETRGAHLVVVTAHGVHVKPWSDANLEMTDDEEPAYWSDGSGAYYVKTGERIPEGCRPISYSGDWLALQASGRRPWLARLDAPMVVVAELPDDHTETDIFADGQKVHVFARRGWRNGEGPMVYQYYDFALEEGPQPVRQVIMPWVSGVWEMDPDSGFAIVLDDNSFWGRVWLLDLNTGKRKWMPTIGWPAYIVKEEVAEKWRELTKP